MAFVATVQALETMSRFKDHLAIWTGIVGVGIGIAGFTLTFIQLQQANESLKASNAYEIQRDARALLTPFISDTTFRDILEKKQEIDNTFRNHNWVFFNFYLSIFRQHSSGELSDEFADSFKHDFCQFLAYERIQDVWNEFKRDRKIDKHHLKMRQEWCPNDSS